MKYDYLALDLDGTVLSKYKKIRPQVYRAISKYVKAGGNIIIATGKTPNGAMVCVRLIEKHAGIKIKYLAALNGNILIDLEHDKVIYEKSMNEDVSHRILDICKKNNIAFFPHTTDGVKNKYIPVYGFWFIFLFKYFNSGLDVFKLDENKHPLAAYKVCVINNKFTFKGFHNATDEIYLKFGKDFEVSPTSKWLWEIHAKGSHKGLALTKIAQLENVSLQRFAAIGDSSNDLSMFDIVGMPIACYHHQKKYNKIKNSVQITIHDRHYRHVAKAIETYLLFQ